MLGPLRVRNGHGWVPVLAAQQRLVLATLLARAGQVVTTDRLVDVVWSDQPPRRAVNTIHRYVVQLRRLLGEGVLVTSDRGYELVVGMDEVDAKVFERSIVAGRRDLERGRTEAGLARLAQGLALWRGQVFADVADHPVLSATVTRLEQARLTAERDPRGCSRTAAGHRGSGPA
jgi:DNA-binding SARP family transcriptional activator